MAEPTLIQAAPPTGPTLAAAPTPAAPAAAQVVATPAPAATPEPSVAAEPAKPAAASPTLLTDAPAEPAKTDAPAQPDAVKTEIPLADGTKPLDADVKPKDGAEEGSKSDEPAPLPTYEAFTLPEGVTLEADRIGNFTNLLGEFEGKTKADHAEVQGLGQKLIDAHIAEVQSALERNAETYRTLWEKQKTDWKDEFLKDPEIGGNRQETTLTAANKFIRTHGGTPDNQQAIRQILDQSGLGNHKVIIGLFAKAAEGMSEGRQLAAPKPVIAAPKSNVERMYGGKKK